MFNQIYKQWWKWLGALLVLFSLVAGLATPVGPGIEHMEPFRQVFAGEVTFDIKGYNTHFQEEENSLQVFLRSGNRYICSEETEIIEDERMTATFLLAGEMEGKSIRLIINNNKDGTFAWKDSIRVQPGESEFPGEQTNCEPEVNVNEPAYFNFPYRIILYETIRNLYFHVPMWFGMTFLLIISFIASIAYLAKFNPKYDTLANQSVNVAILFGLLGFATGALWGHYTWGDLSNWLIRDAKVLGAMIGLLMYFAYVVLRGSMTDQEKKAKTAAVYNIFAFTMYIVFIYVMPRMTDTLHPGSGGNPAFQIYDVDGNMRPVFYSAVLGWILVGMWIMSTKTRMSFLETKIEEREEIRHEQHR